MHNTITNTLLLSCLILISTPLRLWCNFLHSIPNDELDKSLLSSVTLRGPTNDMHGLKEWWMGAIMLLWSYVLWCSLFCYNCMSIFYQFIPMILKLSEANPLRYPCRYWLSTKWGIFLQNDLPSCILFFLLTIFCCWITARNDDNLISDTSCLRARGLRFWG